MKHREDVPFDKRFFTRQAGEGIIKSTEEKFNFIHQNNFWSGKDSVSGEGSDDAQTAAIREALPQIIAEYRIKSMLDIPCGDFNWMQAVDLSMLHYTGADIVEELIAANNKKYACSNKKFIKLNLIEDTLPKADLIFCRDCLVHLSLSDIRASITNIKNSGAAYLLTTTFTGCEVNEDIASGDWRILNFMLQPFHFPQPLLVINENCTEGGGSYSDKSLGLWRIADIERI